MSATDSETGRPLRVLVAEDDPDTALSTAALLRAEGHEAIVAPDGPSALALAEAESPDAVLIDIGLPGLDGYRLAERIRALGREPRPLLVAVTGLGSALDRE